MTRTSLITAALLAACCPVVVTRRRRNRDHALRAALAGYLEMASLRLIAGYGMTGALTQAATGGSADVQQIAALVGAGSVSGPSRGRV